MFYQIFVRNDLKKGNDSLPQTLIFLIPIYLKPNVVNLKYFKLWILMDWFLSKKRCDLRNSAGGTIMEIKRINIFSRKKNVNPVMSLIGVVVNQAWFRARSLIFMFFLGPEILRLQARCRMRSDDTILSDQDVLNIGRGLINTRDSSSSRTENIKVTASRFTPLPSISSSDSEDSSKTSVRKIIKKKTSHVYYYTPIFGIWRQI